MRGMNIGFRIQPVLHRVDPALVARAVAVPASNLGDVMHKMQTMRGGFRSLGGLPGMAGPAFTVRARPGDNLMLHHATDLFEPGDIIVCDGGGELETALTGDLMMGHAVKRGLRGIVLDGAVRDAATLARMPLGVWARAVTACGPTKEGPGEIGFALACGGLMVAPGDLIVADADGVVVIPLEAAAHIVAAAEAHQAQEAAVMARIEAGGWDRPWVAAALREKGCEGS